MGNGSFILYDSDMKSLSYLTDAQIGRLFRAIAKYRLEGTTVSLGKNPAVNILYDQIIEHIMINEKKYQSTCEKRSETMKKRWSERKSKEVDYSALQSTIVESSLLSDNDNGNVNDNNFDFVNENGTDACGAKRENKRKNYYNKNLPRLLQDEPSYDIEAYKQKVIGLKYEKKESTQ